MSTARAVPAKKKRQVKQNAERREASIELLLGAALRLFVSQGFRATNLEQISAAAGLTKGAVYFYFGSKESVLLEVLKRVRAVVVDRALEAVEAAGGDPVNRLVAYIHYQAGLGITHRDEVLLLILMSLEYKERPGEVNDFIASLYRKQRKLIETLVAHGQRARPHPQGRAGAGARGHRPGDPRRHLSRMVPSLLGLRGRELTRALAWCCSAARPLPAKLRAC